VRLELLVGVAIGAAVIPPANASWPAAPGAVAAEAALEDLARIYRAGPRDAAVHAAAGWSDDRITAEVRRFVAADVERARAKGERPVVVLPSLDVVGLDPVTRAAAHERQVMRRAAAAVLAEAAVERLRQGDRRPLGPGLSTASLLLDAEPLGPSEAAFFRCFHLLVGLALHWHVEIAAAHGLLSKASERFPEDPDLQTALGSLVESVAALRRYDRPRGGHAGAAPASGGYASEAGGYGGVLPEVTLARAAAHYEHALVSDPRFDEARLRLARVRLLAGRVDEALPELARVATTAAEPRQRYLAALFMGHAREKRGDPAGAATAFRACLAEGLRTQTAFLALGRSLDSLGDTAGAQEALAAAGALGAPFDPWWSYGSGQPERIDALLSRLRELAVERASP
jgi:hypothetical protein